MSGAVWLIIPTYKERDNIAPLVARIDSALHRRDYRILLVDDDSNDGTAELVGTLSLKYPIDILVRKDKRGLASAVVDGLAKVTGETVVVMDADLQHPPEVLSDLLKKMDDGADIAIASRYVPGGGCQGWGLARRINSKAAIFIAHLLLPSTRRIKDPMSGFFAFRRRAIAGADLKPIGYKVMLEMLVQDEPLRANYMMIPATLPDTLSIEHIHLAQLPTDWRNLPARAELQTLGSDWARLCNSAVLAVPSVVIPAEINYLLNPAHPAFAEIEIGIAQPFITDLRLIKK